MPNVTTSPSYWHFPSGPKTKPYNDYRNKINNRYGNITTICLILFIISIPIYQYLIIHNYRLKYHFLRSFNKKLNHYIDHKHHSNCTTATFKDKFLTRISTIIKSIAFTLFLHYSTISQLIFWFVLLGTLTFIDLYNGDLVFLAKRLGRISANCLPAILFLTLRPSPLPNVLYLTLIPIHKWLSRIIIIQALLHTILYLGYYDFKNTIDKALSIENLYGWLALIGFFIIIVTSLSKFRNKYYKVFYFMHYSFTWIIVLSLQIHVRPKKFTTYTIVNCLILLWQVAYRLYLTKESVKGEVRVFDVSPNLSLIEFPNSLIKNQAAAPAAHIRLTDYASNVFVRLYKQVIPNYHPYTLVTLPQDNYQKLIVRKSNFRLLNGHQYLISGSYDPYLLFITQNSSHKSKFSLARLRINAKRLLIVIGGSAISFALPILRVMNYHGIPTKVVWVIKDFRDVLILKYFDGFIHGDDFEIFITGENTNEKQRLKNMMSCSTMTSNHFDLENEATPLLRNTEQVSLDRENQFENVEVSVNDEEEYDSDCTHEFPTMRAEDTDESDDENENEINFTDADITTTSRKSSLNEPFIPFYTQSSSTHLKSFVQQFKEVTKKLNLENKIYRGRPKLNTRYYNWCINEGFTQCSGPVEDENHNLVCCKDLPRNKIIQEDVNAEKIWVLSAGPKKLVENCKLWASEYGLKFHEEAFYS